MANAVIGALRVNLSLDTAAWEDGLSKVQASLSGIGRRMQSVGTGLSAGVTAPLAALGIASLQTAGDFEAAMNRVGAASNASEAEMQTMRELAMRLGADTSKSASEAADMMEMLAKNGVSTTDIIGGMAEASIKLSEATGGDLATSADVATNVMAQFKLETRDLGKVVDGITGVTLASAFGFEDFRYALASAGGVAGALGVSFEDFNATIAATSSVFSSGQDAGTSFKTFLTTLVPKSDAAKGAMDDLGLEFFDAAGNMKSMSQIAEELKTGLSGLSDEAKTSAVHEIFGADAMRTALALADQGAAGIDAMREATNRVGSANEQAAARMKGFNGEMERLGGAFDNLKIAIGNSGLLAMMTQFVQRVGGIVDQIGRASPEMLKWGVIIGGVAAAIGPLLVGLGLALTAISAISLPVLAAVGAFAALGIGIAAFWGDIQPVLTAFGGKVAAVLGPQITAVIASAKAAFATFRTALRGVFAFDVGSDGAGLLAGIGQLASAVSSMIGDRLLTGITVALQIVKTTIDTVAQGVNWISAILRGDFAGAAGAVRAAFEAMKQGVVSVLQALAPEAQRVAAQILEAFRALPGQMLQIGNDIVMGLANGIRSAAGAAVSAAKAVATDAVGMIKGIFDTNSPSRVMHQVGEWVSQGLANGIGSGGPLAVSAAGSVAQGVTAQMASLGTTAGADPWAGLRESTTGATDSLREMGTVGQGIGSMIGQSFKGLIDGSKGVKDVLTDLLGKLGDMLMDQAFQSLVGGFGGGGNAGGGNLLGSVFSGIGSLFGFADGGKFKVGGAGGIDSQLVAFKASPNETVSITKPGQERRVGGGGYSDKRVFNIDARGAQNGVGDEIRKAIAQYDRESLPVRVQEINDDPRRRG